MIKTLTGRFASNLPLHPSHWLVLNRPPVAGFDSTGDRIEAKIPEIFAMIFLFFNHSERQNPVPVIATMASKIPKYPVPGKRIPAYTSGLA